MNYLERKRSELIRQTLDDIPIIKGEWDNNLLIWRPTTKSRKMLILDHLYEILDPNKELKRVLTDSDFRKLYCHKCNATVNHSMKNRDVECYTKEQSYAEYLNDLGILNYIETYIVNGGIWARIREFDRSPRYLCTKSRQIKCNNDKLHLTPIRTRDTDCHIFADYEIKQSDIDSYNPVDIDPFLLELVDGNIESYKCFMTLFNDIHFSRYNCNTHCIIHCCDKTYNLLNNLFRQLYNRFIRENEYIGFKANLSIKYINEYYQRIGLTYSYDCVVMGQSKYINTIRVYNPGGRSIKTIHTRDLDTEQFPHSSIVKIILDTAMRKY